MDGRSFSSHVHDTATLAIVFVARVLKESSLVNVLECFWSILVVLAVVLGDFMSSLSDMVWEVVSELLTEFLDCATVIADSLLDVLSFVLLNGKNLSLDLTKCTLRVFLDGVLDHLEFDERINR